MSANSDRSIRFTPDSPCTGSISTAAVFESNDAGISTAGIARNPGTSGANGACLASCGVALNAPYVRPWNAWWATTTSPFGRALRTSLIAASLASAPELQKNTTPPSEREHNREARRTFGSL